MLNELRFALWVKGEGGERMWWDWSRCFRVNVERGTIRFRDLSIQERCAWLVRFNGFNRCLNRDDIGGVGMRREEVYIIVGCA
jgi:hypothetical protein